MSGPFGEPDGTRTYAKVVNNLLAMITRTPQSQAGALPLGALLVPFLDQTPSKPLQTYQTKSKENSQSHLP